MLGMISTLSFVLALLSLAAAAVAVVWLQKLSKHMSDLGRRILESEEIEKIITASHKTMTFESRMSECESKTDMAQKQLASHEKKLSELFVSGGTVAKTVERHSADLAEGNKSIKALTNDMLRLKKFQAATEMTRTLVLAAFNAVQEGTPSEDSPSVASQAAETEETSQEPRGLRTVPQAAEPEETSEEPEDGPGMMSQATEPEETSEEPEDDPGMISQAAEREESSEEPERGFGMVPQPVEPEETSEEPEGVFGMVPQPAEPEETSEEP
ncbi:MAG: hypothetical protein ACYS7Y_31640, partial [Planctomycetota bacterium]